MTDLFIISLFTRDIVIGIFIGVGFAFVWSAIQRR